jgi:hypothetical protein
MDAINITNQYEEEEEEEEQSSGSESEDDWDSVRNYNQSVMLSSMIVTFALYCL